MELILAVLAVTATNLGFGIYRTYMKRKMLNISREILDINKKMLTESRRYWGSWKKRAKDIRERKV